MAPSSARAVALMMAMALQLSAAIAAAPPPARIGKPGVAALGRNSCDHPRLLLADGRLLVTEISLANQTVRVVGTGPIINTTGDLTSPGWNRSIDFGPGFWEQSYRLSARNELVVTGCNVMATIWMDIFEQQKPKIVGGCASFCTSDDDDNVQSIMGYAMEGDDNHCSGRMDCCVAPLASSGVPVRNGVQATWLHIGNHTGYQLSFPGIVFVVERGWVSSTDGFEDAPLLLDFAVTKGLLPPRRDQSNCSQDIQHMICQSEHSECSATDPGYSCQCKDGYEGNPYLAGGCQDINECSFSGETRVCFGVCINTNGSYVCQCR